MVHNIVHTLTTMSMKARPESANTIRAYHGADWNFTLPINTLNCAGKPPPTASLIHFPDRLGVPAMYESCTRHNSLTLSDDAID